MKRPGLHTLNHLISPLLLALFTLLILPLGASAQSASVASLYASEGAVSVRKVGGSSWAAVKTGDSFSEGDTIRTGTDGKAAIQFIDGALVRLGRYSALTFEKVSPAGNPSVTHTEGQAYFFSRGAKREPEIKTKTVNAAIFGTELVIEASAQSTTIDVLHGSVQAFNSHGSVSLAPGQRAVTKLGEAPTKSILVRPAEAVQWMINFPFVLAESDLVPSPDPGCDTSCEAAIREVLTEVSHGTSLLRALEQRGAPLASVPRGKLLKAIALWRVGDPQGGTAVLASLPATMSPTDMALRDVVMAFSKLIRGDPKGAESALESAKSFRSGLVNEDLLASYIEQSQGDLEDALEVITTAREQHSDVPSLYDREAELLLSFDRYSDATDLLNERLRKFGSSSMNSILEGFAAISRKEFDQAEADFLKAQREDPSQSLAYLGQALVKVNNQDYASTKTLLSKAVQLDPAVSSYRSYLGKLFFDDEHSEKARKEYDAAIELDSNDPTPYLYRSYVDVAQNDVIGGLADVEQSIKLNDNRAVYRSSLLLDRDLAVRGAGLSRVFTELGFDQIARVEAIKSISDDYSNFSAHRLLSDSYDSIMDVDARVSEERIANILSPLSFNIFNSLGESAALGDYNALFDKKENREAFSAQWVNNQNQVGSQLLATGKTDTFGYLFRYQPYYSNASQDSFHTSQNRLRGAVQYEATPDDRLVLEGNFNAFNASEKSEDGSYSENVHVGNVLLGYNHRFSSQTTFLLQGEYARDSEQTSITNYNRPNWLGFSPDDEQFLDTLLTLQQDAKQRVNRNGLSGQVIHTSKYVDSVTGVQGLYVDPSRRENSPVNAVCSADDPTDCYAPLVGNIPTSSSGNLTSGTVYEYLSFKIPRTANLTLGLAGTSVEYDLAEVPPFLTGSSRESKLDPKVGLVTTPFSWLTTRAAYFQTLQKTVLEDQSSLEPTLVGGLNQQFNDLSGAQSENYAFGLDAKLPNQVYAGAQYTHRNISEPIGTVDQFTVIPAPNEIYLLGLEDAGFMNSYSESQIFRNYIYSVLTDSTVFTADSLLNWYNVSDPGQPDATIDTRRFRFGARQFWGKHLSFNVQGTYRNQNLTEVIDPYTGSLVPAGGGFWLFDTGASYRFAEQHGNIFFRIDNILNRDFDYFQGTGLEPFIIEGRSFVLGVNYNFF